MAPATAVVIDALSDGCYVEVEVVAAKIGDAFDTTDPVKRFGLPGDSAPTP